MDTTRSHSLLCQSLRALAGALAVDESGMKTHTAESTYFSRSTVMRNLTEVTATMQYSTSSRNPAHSRFGASHNDGIAINTHHFGPDHRYQSLGCVGYQIFHSQYLPWGQDFNPWRDSATL
jgi:hypothetical protein